MIDKPLKKKIIKSILVNMPIDDIAQKAKKNRRTIWLWKKEDPDLIIAQQKYEAIIRNIWS